MDNNENIDTQGIDLLVQAIEKTYDKVELTFYRPLISAKLGGDFLLDSVGIYKTADTVELLTLGFSDLYEKEIDNGEYSGYGFELSFKLKTTGMTDEEIDTEVRNICSIYNTLADYAFGSGAVFNPNEYIYTGQTEGLDSNQKSEIVGFITRLHKAGVIDTPNGKVELLQLVGATYNEINAIINKEKKVVELNEMLPSDITDYNRKSLI